MIVREMGQTLEALEAREFSTCSTANQTLAGSTANAAKDNGSGTTFLGRIIDRLGDMISGARWQACIPAAKLWTTRGTTEADAMMQLGVRLEHGDSSGGGDMARYSTDQQPADVTFFTTQRTTAESEYSTGEVRFQTGPAMYDLRAAKRWIRVAVFARKNRATTESSGTEGGRLSADLTFIGADRYPPAPWTSQGSTSTST